MDEWTAELGLTFSPNKTVDMMNRKRKKRIDELIEIMLRDQIIPCKESTQLLEMTLDSRLKWEEHIKKLRAKTKRTLNTIRVIEGKK